MSENILLHEEINCEDESGEENGDKDDDVDEDSSDQDNLNLQIASVKKGY